MLASTSLNASVELARAIASIHTILRTGPVIASGLDDQRYALGDWCQQEPNSEPSLGSESGASWASPVTDAQAAVLRRAGAAAVVADLHGDVERTADDREPPSS